MQARPRHLKFHRLTTQLMYPRTSIINLLLMRRIHLIPSFQLLIRYNFLLRDQLDLFTKLTKTLILLLNHTSRILDLLRISLRKNAILFHLSRINSDQLLGMIQLATKLYRMLLSSRNFTFNLNQRFPNRNITLFNLLHFTTNHSQLLFRLSQLSLKLNDLIINNLKIFASSINIQLSKLRAKRLIAPRLTSLSLQRTYLTLHFANNISQSYQVSFRMIKLTYSFFFISLILGDPTSLFKYATAILWTRT